jgi:hypothetical protein
MENRMMAEALPDIVQLQTGHESIPFDVPSEGSRERTGSRISSLMFPTVCVELISSSR